MTAQEWIATIPTACPEGLAWAKAEGICSDVEAWTKLQRPDWMLWLCGIRKIEPDKIKIRLFACDCAEAALLIYEEKYPDDKRLRVAIETARMHTTGKVTQKQLAAARDAAWDAAGDAAGTAAGDAARAAAWAAAGDAAGDAARAADWAAVRDDARAKQADLLRQYFPNPLAEAK